MNQIKEQSSFFLPFYRYIQSVNQRVTKALEISTQNNSILVLDGLRAIACLSVIFFHFRWLSSENISAFPTKGPLAFVTAFFLFGNSGVILFFLLSGFLLFLPFAKALLIKDSQWPSLRRFYLRRVFRIIPAYYVALFLIIIFSHPEFLQFAQWHVIVQFLTFTMNYNLAQQINGVFWTLAVEFQFYLLLPLIVWLMSLVVRRGSVHWRFTKLVLCLFAMIGWGLATRYWALYLVDTPKLDWLLPHSVDVTLRLILYGDLGPPESGKYFEVFGLGMLLCAFYIYSCNTPQTITWQSIAQRLSPYVALVGLSILAFLTVWNLYFINVGAGPTLQPLFRTYEGILMNIWPLWRPFLIGLGFTLCMFALLHGPTWLKRPLEWNPLRWLGAISYSLYIWHMPLAYLFLGYSFIYIHSPHHLMQYVISLLWVLIVIIPFATTSYRHIERPGVRLGEAILRKLGKQQNQPSTAPAGNIALRKIQLVKITHTS